MNKILPLDTPEDIQKRIDKIVNDVRVRKESTLLIESERNKKYFNIYTKKHEVSL